MVILDITRCPALLVFLLAGAVAVLFAFCTVNLFTEAVPSLRFFDKFGWVAVMHGGLWQVAELAFWGALALALWLVFKLCETDLTNRYRRWSRRWRGPGQDPG